MFAMSATQRQSPGDPRLLWDLNLLHLQCVISGWGLRFRVGGGGKHLEKHKPYRKTNTPDPLPECVGKKSKLVVYQY